MQIDTNQPLNELLRSADTLILDARSYAHLIYMLSIIEDAKVLSKSTLLTSSKYVDTTTLHKSIYLPESKIILDCEISDQGLFLKFALISKIKIALKKFKGKGKILLLTSYNYGLFYGIIKSVLRLTDAQVVLLDDGIGNKIKIRNRRVVKTIFNIVHGVFISPAKLRLQDDQNIKNIATIFRHNISRKRVVGRNFYHISKLVNKYHVRVCSTTSLKSIEYNSALLLTHHAVESGRLGELEYKEKIKKIVELILSLGYKNIYLSKHHRESLIHDQFYEDLNLISLEGRLPAELIVSSGKVKLVAQPFNSCIPVLDALDTLKCLDHVISYEIDKSPFINERKFEVNKILEKYPLRSITLE